MSCDHHCAPPAVFPKVIANRPGLPRIDYRIGTSAELRERMIQLLNSDARLAAWTHRGADDPGIALLESTAVVGDILTFYQQLYANEQYLRTAQWRESVAELVRLLGYRLTPGIGGEAKFALAVKGESAVTVPQGFGLKAQLEGQDAPSEFESTSEITAYPHLSQFHLYRPRSTPHSTSGTQSFYVFALEGVPEGLSFKSGDRVLVGTASFDVARRGATGGTGLNDAQILIVARSWESFGDLFVEFTTGLKWSGSTFQLQAYKLGETWRHFGHNAPPVYFEISGDTTVPKSTYYLRVEWRDQDSSVFNGMDFSAAPVEVPLDRQVSNLAGGDYVLIQCSSAPSPGRWVYTPRTLVAQVASTTDKSLTYGSVSGLSTVLTLEQSLFAMLGDNSDYYAYGTDLRTMSIHQVSGAPFVLRAQHQPTTAASGNQLYYYGTDVQAKALLGRELLLQGPEAQTQTATVTEVQSLAPENAARDLFRRITLDAEVAYANFDHDAPQVTAYGNLVAATQGKTQAEIVLGSGDQRVAFQTFPLPKSPLTYLLDETRTPAQVPQLHIHVNGIEWLQVESFFNAAPDDAVYIVREDDDNQSYVQFGDGKNGRRLPSGLKNISAVYRVGQGAYGSLQAGTQPQITGKLKDFDKLYLPEPVNVGAPREDAANARIAGPGKIQSLGRIVSLADVETEALALPHVLKARALWIAPEGIPLVSLVVLTENGSAADLAAVRDSMSTFNRSRGPARYPIDVVHGLRQFVHLKIEAGYDAAFREEDVLNAVKQSLGLMGEEGNGGLFDLRARQFGQGAHNSQIIASVQNTAGVAWVKLKSAQLIDAGTPPQTDPVLLAAPASDLVVTTLACAGDRVLSLYGGHLTVSLSTNAMAQGDAA